MKEVSAFNRREGAGYQHVLDSNRWDFDPDWESMATEVGRRVPKRIAYNLINAVFSDVAVNVSQALFYSGLNLVDNIRKFSDPLTHNYCKKDKRKRFQRLREELRVKNF